MPNRVRILTVTDADRAKLERRARDRGAQARVAERARIVLLAAEGLTGPQIAGAGRVHGADGDQVAAAVRRGRAWPGWRTRRGRAGRRRC